jgi:Agrobacterium tumefaciens protein Atu4866
MMGGDIENVAGMWISIDARMRVELKADGTFDEVRTDSARTFHGLWHCDGTRIHFRDPTTGYEATGTFRDGVLHADGVDFRRVT